MEYYRTPRYEGAVKLLAWGSLKVTPIIAITHPLIRTIQQ